MVFWSSLHQRLVLLFMIVSKATLCSSFASCVLPSFGLVRLRNKEHHKKDAWMAPEDDNDSKNDQDTQALKSFVRLAARLPDPTRYDGTSPYIPTFPSSFYDGDDHLLSSLLTRAKLAPYGLGNQTTFNTNVRKTLQIDASEDDNLDILPTWEGLHEALEEIAHALTPGIRLEAQLDKILVYRPGDFFREHCDSKKSEHHIMTMSVICGGYGPVGKGAVCFHNPDDNDEDKQVNGKRSHSNCWEATEPGSFACWFNTESHSVLTVENNHRVGLQYKVLATERTAEVEEFLKEHWQGPLIGPASWREELPRIVPSLGDHSQWGYKNHPYYLFLEFLHREKANIFETIRKNYCARKYLGVLLKHEYSLDGNLHVNPLHLRGNDAWLGTALTRVFGADRWTTRRAVLFATVEQYGDTHLEDEIVSDGVDEFLLEAKVLQDITDNSIGDFPEDESVDIPAEYLHLVPPGKTKLNYDTMRELEEPSVIDHDWTGGCPRVESDGPFLDGNGLYWPFFQTLLMLRPGDLVRVTTRMNDRKREGFARWGNEAQYEIFTYSTTALVLTLDGDGTDDASGDEDDALMLRFACFGPTQLEKVTSDDMITIFVPEHNGDDVDRRLSWHMLICK